MNTNNRVLLVTAVMLLLSAPSAAEAQLCRGSLDFRRAPVQLAGDASLSDDATSVGGSLGFGNSGSFGFLSAAIVNFDDFDASAPAIGGTVGTSIALNPGRTVSLCPIASASYLLGPNDVLGTGVDLRELDLGGGVAVGGEVKLSPTTSLIPFAGASLVYARLSLKAGSETESETETYGVLNFGAGLAVNEAFVIRPGVAVPVGLEGAKSSFTIGLVFPLSRRQ